MTKKMETFDVLELKIMIEHGYKGDIMDYAVGVDMLRKAINQFMEEGTEENIALLHMARNALMTDKTTVIVD